MLSSFRRCGRCSLATLIFALPSGACDFGIDSIDPPKLQLDKLIDPAPVGRIRVTNGAGRLLAEQKNSEARYSQNLPGISPDDFDGQMTVTITDDGKEVYRQTLTHDLGNPVKLTWTGTRFVPESVGPQEDETLGD